MQHPTPPHPTAEPTATARLRVALFAGVADAAGSRVLDLPWRAGTVADVRAAAAKACPAAASLVARSAVAVGGRLAGDDTSVAAGDDVAILPPVSGG